MLERTLKGGLYSAIMRLLWTKGKLHVVHIEESPRKPDMDYVLLVEKLARESKCHTVILVTCDNEMYDKARRRFKTTQQYMS